uniref:Uncharacterized protein n=1 Tax=Heterorhabditis bacteriophora TaxID=37862 RepID=A0A1I7WKV8_HETBA
MIDYFYINNSSELGNFSLRNDNYFLCILFYDNPLLLSSRNIAGYSKNGIAEDNKVVKV